MMHEILKRFTNYTYVGVCTKVYGGVNDARNIEMIYKLYLCRGLYKGLQRCE